MAGVSPGTLQGGLRYGKEMYDPCIHKCRYGETTS